MTAPHQLSKEWDQMGALLSSQVLAESDPFPDATAHFTAGIKPMTLPIATMLTHLNALAPLKDATAILDTGCGGGAVFRALLSPYARHLQLSATAELIAADFSAGLVAEVARAKQAALEKDGDSAWKRVDPRVLDAMALEGIRDATVSHVTASFVLFMVPDPSRALRETHRVLQGNGVLTLSSWKDSDWIQAMDAVPGVAADALPDAWRSCAGVRAQLEGAGFKDVEAREVETGMGYQDVDACAEVFWGLPHMRTRIRELGAEEERERKAEMRRRLVEVGGVGPAVLRGVAIVAWGRK